MKTSESIAKIVEALSAAQGMFKNPEKNRTAKIPMKSGGSYSFNYADLPGMLDISREVLAKNGLAHFATKEFIGDYLLLTMRLAHKSGEWIESSVPIHTWSDEKHLAAQVTYYRRYLFQSLLGIAGEEDIDGTPDVPGAQTGPRENSQKQGNFGLKPNTQDQAKKVTEPQLNRLFAIAKQHNVPNEQVKKIMTDLFKIESSKDLTREQYDKLIAIIELQSAEPQEMFNPNGSARI